MTRGMWTPMRPREAVRIRYLDDHAMSRWRSGMVVGEDERLVAHHQMVVGVRLVLKLDQSPCHLVHVRFLVHARAVVAQGWHVRSAQVDEIVQRHRYRI